MSSRHNAIPKPAAVQASPNPARKADLTRTLLFLSVLFVVPLLGATYWMYVQAEREIENTELQNDLVRARTVAALVERDFASAKNVLVSIAHRQAYQLSWAKRDLPAVDLHLQEVRKLEPAFLFTSAYEMDGTMRTITPDDPIVGLNFAYRDWYRGVTARWKPYVSEVYRTAASTHPLVVAVAVPIRNEENKPDGILMSTYALDELAHKFNELEAGSPGGELYVVDQHGFMATSPAIDPLAEPKHAPQTEAASLALAGKEGSGRFRNGSEDDFLGYAPVSRLGWAVIYRRPAREALASAVRLRQRTLSTGLYLLLIYLATATLAAILVRRQGKLVVANEKLNRELEGQIAEATRAREELDRFFTQSIDMLCIAGFDGHFKRLNPAWEKTVGYSTQDLIASPYVDFIHPDDRELTIREAEKLVAGGETVCFENRYRCKDGSYKWLLWTSTPFSAQQLIYAMRKGHYGPQAGRSSPQAGQGGSRTRQQVQGSVSFDDEPRAAHAASTPFSGFSDLLADENYGPLNERQRRYVDHIHTGGKHLLSAHQRHSRPIQDRGRAHGAGPRECSRGDVTFGEVLERHAAAGGQEVAGIVENRRT